MNNQRTNPMNDLTDIDSRIIALVNARAVALAASDAFGQAGNLSEYDRAMDEYAHVQSDLQRLWQERAAAKRTTLPTLRPITAQVRQFSARHIDDGSPAMLPEPEFLEGDGPIEADDYRKGHPLDRF